MDLENKTLSETGRRRKVGVVLTTFLIWHPDVRAELPVPLKTFHSQTGQDMSSTCMRDFHDGIDGIDECNNACEYKNLKSTIIEAGPQKNHSTEQERVRESTNQP